MGWWLVIFHSLYSLTEPVQQVFLFNVLLYTGTVCIHVFPIMIYNYYGEYIFLCIWMKHGFFLANRGAGWGGGDTTNISKISQCTVNTRSSCFFLLPCLTKKIQILPVFLTILWRKPLYILGVVDRTSALNLDNLENTEFFIHVWFLKLVGTRKWRAWPILLF